MKQITCGGNIIKALDLATKKEKGLSVFADGDYFYHYVELEAGESHLLSGLLSFSAYVLKKDPSSKVILNGEASLDEGDVIQGEKASASLAAIDGKIELLIAGLKEPKADSPILNLEQKVSIIKAQNIKKVSKPWGHELWINGEHPGYAFKQIYIKSGTKTSLQYHRFKRETNVLFSGIASLHYKINTQVENDFVTVKDLATHSLAPVSAVDVFPNTLHRLEAVTDVLLYEVSTPHLDDVVRISDDAGRGHGRIHAEHQAHQLSQ